MSETSGRIYTPRSSFVARIGDVDVTMVPGRHRVREGHELLERFPDLFEEILVQFEVEEATAEPGRRRAR